MTQQQVTIPTIPLLIPRSSTSTEGNLTGSWRFLRPCYDEKTAPCSTGCPTGEDIGRIEMLTAQGQFKEAWETILLENPLPAVCGRVCFHPCEAVCNRAEFDKAVAIHTLERFLADTASRYELKPNVERARPRAEKIAVIGSGPGGLAAAYFLNVLGYSCDVFEARPEPGGLLRWGIPPYRLPAKVVAEEIQRIASMGVAFHCGRKIDKAQLEELKGRYRAIFISCGHSRDRSLDIVGEDLPGVFQGLRFLDAVRRGESPRLNGDVAVIGGGNTAIDVARCLVRMGARPVIYYRRRREDMPAFAEEIGMAEEEGIEIRERLNPVAIEAGERGGYRLSLQAMRVSGQDHDGRARLEPEPGKTEQVAVQGVVKAVGGEPAADWMRPPNDNAETVQLDGCTLQLGVKPAASAVLVFGGDLAARRKSVVHAVASGKEAAMALDVLFREGPEAIRGRLDACRVGAGPARSMEIYLHGERSRRNPHVVTFSEINTDYFRFEPRIEQPRLLREERIASFAEIDLKISGNLAIREAERCFNCGLCNQCDNCRLFCPEIAVKTDSSNQGRHINYDYCKGCGLCVVECPRNAMALEEENA